MFLNCQQTRNIERMTSKLWDDAHLNTLSVRLTTLHITILIFSHLYDCFTCSRGNFATAQGQEKKDFHFL